MKYFQHISAFILFLSLLLASCEETQPTSTTTTELVPRQLEVLFNRDVTVSEASSLLTDLSLQAIDLSSLESPEEQNLAIVGVPEGEEKIWAKRLAHYPIIISTRQKSRTVSGN